MLASRCDTPVRAWRQAFLHCRISGFETVDFPLLLRGLDRNILL